MQIYINSFTLHLKTLQRLSGSLFSLLANESSDNGFLFNPLTNVNTMYLSGYSYANQVVLSTPANQCLGHTNALLYSCICWYHVSFQRGIPRHSPFSRHSSVGGMVITVHLLWGNTIRYLSLYNSGLNYCHKNAPSPLYTVPVGNCRTHSTCFPKL